MTNDPDLGLKPCQCCHHAPGTVGDPHLGQVCAECYLCLIEARGLMEKIGPCVGISGCAPHSALRTPKSDLP